MRRTPTSMNNRQPAGSRDSEQSEAPMSSDAALRAFRVRKTPVRTRSAEPGRGPLLSGAVLGPDQDSKGPPHS
jgi:hypothetical protein